MQARLSGSHNTTSASAAGATVAAPAPAHLPAEDGTVAPPPYRPPPPKYEDSDIREPGEGQGSTELGRGGQARDASSIISVTVPNLDSDNGGAGAVEMTEMRSGGEGAEEDGVAAYERRTRRDNANRADDGVAPRPAEPDPLDPSSDRPYGIAPAAQGNVVGEEEQPSWWARLVRRS